MNLLRIPVLFATIVVAVLGVACREEAGPAGAFTPRERPATGDPRSFLLGFSDLPPELSDEAYRAQYDLAAHFGEAILLQRTLSWSDFLPGNTLSDTLPEQVLREREAARERDLTIVPALDPFDPGDRARLQGLPAAMEGRSLADPDLRAAFVAEAKFIARNMRPEFLALGTEVNATFERNPEGYFAFVEAYREAYDAVKEVSPQTQVFVTFQYEELLGVVPELPPHAPRWELLDGFDGRLDLVGVSTYPSFAYPTARKVPVEYFRQLRDHTQLPIAFVGVGFASGPGRGGVNASTEPEQRRFLQRLLEDAFWLQSPLLIWFAADDPGFADTPPYDLLATIGLRDATGAPKEAWTVWVDASNRPLDAEGAAALLRDQEAEAEATPAPASLSPGG